VRKFGLIGYPLGHSFSKTFFTDKFCKEGLEDCIYENFPIESIDVLPQLIKEEPDLRGLNVTIPYKQKVLAYLNQVDPQAKEIGAVNTIKIFREQDPAILKGYNTDMYGFEEPLLRALKPHHKSALVLGTGGASRAVIYVLKKHGISYRYVSRNPGNKEILSYQQLTPEILDEHKIIINCSPLGMHPHEDKCPDLPYEAVTGRHILYDLIYNPDRTLFLQKGERKKATLINGLPMLYIQAEKSWEIWNTRI
jgi:shikimate dehydrogenase